MPAEGEVHHTTVSSLDQQRRHRRMGTMMTLAVSVKMGCAVNISEKGMQPFASARIVHPV